MRKPSLCCAAYLGAGVLFAQVAPPPAPRLPDNVEVDANISYDQYPETKLDIYRPKGTASKKRPGVIVIHGGGWINGTKEGAIASFALRYLEQGFVVCNVEYRLARAAKAPAAVSDVLTATKWFFDNAGKYGVDKKKIIATGDSAGGHLALMAGMATKSARLGPTSDVAAVVNFYGITDVADLLSGPDMRDYAVEWVPEQEGRIDLARRVSPLTYVSKDSPPIFTVHGDADQTVPYQQGVELTRELRESGVEAELYPVGGGGHGGFAPEKMTQIYSEVFRFLRKHEVIDR